ncbi:MAG: hypothetical protein K2K39_01255 [Clostridia bacterium]|nr:hypothetical protein [Clostridia bacterium]
MKYVRKVMAAGLAIVFLIALVIGTGIILSVRNVNVTFVDYSGRYEEDFNATRAELNKLKGSGLLFINDGDVYGKVTSSQKLAIVSYEKKFPCTVNVTVRERVECFTVKTADGYAVYDDYGKLIRTPADDTTEPLAWDGCPNVTLEAQPERYEDVAKMCRHFSERFGSLRRMVESVTADKFLGVEVAYLKLRTGLTIALNEWTENTEAKIEEAYKTYCTLSDRQRITGRMTVVDGKNNSGPIAKYPG